MSFSPRGAPRPVRCAVVQPAALANETLRAPLRCAWRVRRSGAPRRTGALGLGLRRATTGPLARRGDAIDGIRADHAASQGLIGRARRGATGLDRVNRLATACGGWP
jgi:hypothetical protein